MATKKSSIAKIQPFSKQSIDAIKKVILEKEREKRHKSLKDGIFTQEKLWQNLPELKTIVFLHTSLPHNQKIRILTMLQSMLAASQVKVIFASTTVRAMFTLPQQHLSTYKFAVFPEYSPNPPLLFKNVKHFMENTSPELVLVFSPQAHTTDDVHCFQVKKDEIFYTSKPNRKMEEVCLMEIVQEKEDEDEPANEDLSLELLTTS